MKKLNLILFVLFTLLGYGSLFAQKEIRTLTFVYIVHDRTTPVNSLAEKLEEFYNQGQRFPENAYIFYLANRNRPNVVTQNLPNDNSKDFETLILGELQNRLEHNINVGYDVDSIIDIFNQNDFLNETGNLKYESVIWDFYVTEDFWASKNHESLIAKLYWIMDIAKLKEQDFRFQIRCSKDLFRKIENETQNFGIKNLANINNDLYPTEY